MHEFGADRSAIVSARLVGGFTGEPLKVLCFEGLQQAERIEIRFEVAPPAERVENQFAILAGWRRVLRSSRCFAWSFRFQCSSVCHVACPQASIVPHQRNRRYAMAA